ncbi:MAG: hypothetical protein PSX80_09885, partial [bacterium]|nr:hypothetical protein [bacterium]
VTFLLLAAASVSLAQDPPKATVQAAMRRFPTVPEPYIEAMIVAKRVMSIALPTWLPPGFKFEKLKARIGREVSLEDREFVVIYSRTQDGKTQRFALEAGFDGLGGLPYEPTQVIRSSVGQIDLMYEPKDLDDEKKVLKNYVYTEWFKVRTRTDWHYIGMYGAPEEGDPGIAMISLADTERILKSLQAL